MNKLVNDFIFVCNFLTVVTLFAFGLSASNVKNSFAFFLLAGFSAFTLIIINQCCIDVEMHQEEE